MSESPTAERLAFRDGVQFAFDNTSLSIYKECPRKYKLAILDGWAPKTKAPPLLFGGWMHGAQEVYDRELVKHSSHEIALREAVRFALIATVHREDDGTFTPWVSDDPNRSRLTLVRSIVWYCEHFKEDSLKTLILPSGQPALELSFRMALPTHQEFYYCGHIDKIATYGPHGIFIQERKHTKTTIGSYYFEKYNPNSQISGYVLAAQTLSQTHVEGSVIDAIQVGATFSRPARGIERRTPAMLEEWMDDTIIWIERIHAATLSQSFPMNTESCHKYRGCQFRGVCSHSASVRDMILQTDFSKRFWDPLKVRTVEED